MAIKRYDINKEYAHSGLVEAGDYIFINYCVGNVGLPIDSQIIGAFNHLEQRLESIGLELDSVVKIDCLFKNIWDIPHMEKVIKNKFNGTYPARKSIQTEFAHNDLLFQLDAIAYRKK